MVKTDNPPARLIGVSDHFSVAVLILAAADFERTAEGSALRATSSSSS